MSGPNPIVTIGNARFGNALPLALIAGPCQLESRAHALEMASALKEIAGRLGIALVYKTSFDKANRTSGRAARGMRLAAIRFALRDPAAARAALGTSASERMNKLVVGPEVVHGATLVFEM